MFHWYLIQSKPSGECVAETNLERQGYEVYFPRLARPVRRRGQWREQITSLFPRYLFLHLNEGQQSLSPVGSTFGVASVVRFGRNYATVPDHVVYNLRNRADPCTGLHRLNCMESLRAGARVRVTMGAFDGLEGIFEREAGCDRVVVLLHLLGQNTRVRLPTSFIVASQAVA